MNENINALDEINKGACMGEDALNIIIEKVEDKEFKKELESQYNEYKKISQRIKEIYPKYDKGKPHETNSMNKAMTWSMLEMKTINDTSNSKLAEILLNGVNMGIIEGRRILNNKKINKEVNQLVSDYVTMQEKNVDILKNYL